MNGHPTREDLLAFAEGRLPRERTAEVVLHFLHGCGSCQEEAARLNLWHLRQMRERRPPVRRWADEDEARPALTEVRLPLTMF